MTHNQTGLTAGAYTPPAGTYPAPGAPAWTPPAPESTRPLYTPPAPAAPPPGAPEEPLLAPPSPGRPELERLLHALVTNDGSDLHLAAGQPPRFRVRGQLRPVAGEPAYSDEHVERILVEALAPAVWAEFRETHDLDTAYAMSVAGGAALDARFRVNVFQAMGRLALVARVIPTQIPTLDELGLLPQIKTLAAKPRGLILVCGPTGSGKSTTMAALIDEINQTRYDRIVTFEDPIEFVHQPKKCLISHREVGTDTPSFAEGLRRVRRQDPDIILIGEMRDYETIDAAIEAADTGHLVLGTLHTNSAPETLSRIINSFPTGRQNQVRMTLSSVLLSVICQTLVPAETGGRGRVAATEIMMVTPGIRNNIRENDIPSIAGALVDTSEGSISLDAHLAALVRTGQVSQKAALEKAGSPGNLLRYLGQSDRP